ARVDVMSISIDPPVPRVGNLPPRLRIGEKAADLRDELVGTAEENDLRILLEKRPQVIGPHRHEWPAARRDLEASARIRVAVADGEERKGQLGRVQGLGVMDSFDGRPKVRAKPLDDLGGPLRSPGDEREADQAVE